MLFYVLDIDNMGNNATFCLHFSWKRIYSGKNNLLFLRKIAHHKVPYFLRFLKILGKLSKNVCGSGGWKTS